MAFLGIDAGASSTKWVVSDGATIKERGVTDPMDGHIYREESLARMTRVLREIGTKARGITALYAGITGISDQTRPTIIKMISERFVSSKIHLVTDIELAYRAHFAPGEGIFLYAGTGAVALHIAPDQKITQVGGWGYLLGDEGGGYWIGREAIRRVLTSWDSGREIANGSFEREILNAIKCENWNDIKAFVYSHNRSAIAALARSVFELSERGDTDAQSVLRSAAQHLAALVKQMDMRVAGSQVPVVFAGGLSQPGSYLWKTLEREITNTLSPSEVDIAERAAQLAGNL